jgi:GTPase Era involved in 16S rRNA processing
LSAITTATVETVAKQAINLGQNAAALKQAGQAAKQQAGNLLNGLLNNK